jgi:hypothetical protein
MRVCARGGGAGDVARPVVLLRNPVLQAPTKLEITCSLRNGSIQRGDAECLRVMAGSRRRERHPKELLAMVHNGLAVHSEEPIPVEVVKRVGRFRVLRLANLNLKQAATLYVDEPPQFWITATAHKRSVAQDLETADRPGAAPQFVVAESCKACLPLFQVFGVCHVRETQSGVDCVDGSASNCIARALCTRRAMAGQQKIAQHLNPTANRCEEGAWRLAANAIKVGNVVHCAIGKIPERDGETDNGGWGPMIAVVGAGRSNHIGFGRSAHLLLNEVAESVARELILYRSLNCLSERCCNRVSQFMRAKTSMRRLGRGWRRHAAQRATAWALALRTRSAPAFAAVGHAMTS